MAFKIYTKTGDKGSTSLIGGVRVSKHHIRIESYGTIDELNSYLGMVQDAFAAGAKIKEEDRVEVQEWLREIQDRLFTIGSELATAPDKKVKMKLPDLHPEDLIWLEERIDKMNEALPEMRSFLLPGGDMAGSMCHVARCICRRAERICVGMVESDEHIPELIVPYLNRLSDFLFVLARYLGQLGEAEEVPWRARV